MIIGVGIDLVDVERVQRMLDAHGTRLVQRLFTDAERDYAMRMARPALHLAVRLAAKEAAFKALSGTKGAERATELAIARCHCSLTHTDTSAAAVVVLESAG
jgi:holo-[acyl-carrier protein] synthase